MKINYLARNPTNVYIALKLNEIYYSQFLAQLIILLNFFICPPTPLKIKLTQEDENAI